jgi:23S rRNA pseudouridine955/2504/2580 synthase
MKSRDTEANTHLRHKSVEYVLISADQAGRRIDNYLYSSLQHIPRSRIYQMIRRGEVRIDGRRVKQGYRLQEGERLRIPPVSLRENAVPEQPRQYLLDMIENNIVYDDHDLLIVNKPPGIVVHGGTGRSFGVIELLRILLKQEQSSLQLAHRLDRDTSGILLIARNMHYLAYLHECFKNRRIKKTYKALLKGRLEQRITHIDKALTRNIKRGGERLSSVDSTGKLAETIFTRLEFIRDSTLAEVEIKTGRTHQIRVHAAFIQHPLAGDDKYGIKTYNKMLRKAGLKRLFLHAESITIPAYKNKRAVTVSIPLADDLQAFLLGLKTAK